MLEKKIRFIFGSIIVMLVSFVISGCWDYKEIENRGYVLGVAIDYAKSSNPQTEYDLDRAFQTSGERKYRVTFEMPKFVKSEQGGEQQKGGAHLIWASEGESMFATTRSIGQKVYFAPFFEDIQVMIFSEPVARKGIGDILDFFLRDPEMRRRLYLYVTPGRAEDILKANMQVEEPNSTFLYKLTRNVDKVPYYSGKAEIGKIAEAIRAKKSFIIPIVYTDGTDLKLEEGAVFNREQRMVGKLDAYEVIGGKILRRMLKEGAFPVPNPASPQRLAVFELYESNLEVTPKLEGDKLSFSVKAKLIGTLGENTEPRQDAFDMNFIAAVEHTLSDEFAGLVRLSYQKQQLLKADITELGALVYHKYPDYWASIKDRWDDEVFPTIPLDKVEVDVRIRRPALQR